MIKTTLAVSTAFYGYMKSIFCNSVAHKSKKSFLKYSPRSKAKELESE
jgi:hypothetical protein